MIADSLPYWPVNPSLSSSNWYTFQLDMVRCLWAILPPTLLWGASFPLALAAAAAAGRRSGAAGGRRLCGQHAGRDRRRAERQPVPGPRDRHGGDAEAAPRAFGRERMAAAGAALPRGPGGDRAGGVPGRSRRPVVPKINRVPAEVIAFGRQVAMNMGKARILEVIEGRNSSAVISQWEDGAMQIDVNGHVEATNEPFDMKLQRMVGHLAALLHPNPKSVLGIGFGAGVSAGTFTRYPSVEQHHGLRDRAGDSAALDQVLRQGRITTSCTTRARGSCSTTRGTT